MKRDVSDGEELISAREEHVCLHRMLRELLVVGEVVW